MNLDLYLEPVDFSGFSLAGWTQKKYTLGTLLEKNREKVPAAKAKVAIIGVPEDRNAIEKGSAKAPDKIREHLYQLNRIGARFKMVDLGNIKQGKSASDTYFALKDVCSWLMEMDVAVIVLGGSQDLTFGLTKAFEHQYFNLITVDPKIDIHRGAKTIDSENYLGFVTEKHRNLFSTSILGYQNYFTDAVELSQSINNNLEARRLGQLRYSMAEIEPYMRGADLFSFDLNAVRSVDAPGQYFGSPNGLYAEEACQVAHYAGMADKMKIAGFFNLVPSKDRDDLSAKLMAQVVWHFLEGFHFRVVEDPERRPQEFNEFIIDMDDVDLPLTFFQSRKTGRWWMKLYNQNTDSDHVIPCSQEDYDLAARYEIPDRWWRNIRKLNQLAK